ncbi:MAG: type II CAAX prenyl endopeptidase Rce1 family protein [Anaerolineae bacterium]
MSEKQRKSWLLWIGWSVAAVALIIGLAIDEGKADNLLSRATVALIIGLAPLIGAQLALGSPAVLSTVTTWLRSTQRPLRHTAGGITALYLITGLLVGRFDPYALVIVGVGVFAALGALRQTAPGQAGLTWMDVSIWMLLWIPFDLRWNYDLWFGPDGFAYNWWAVAISVTAVIGWASFRGLPDFGYRLTPRWRDMGIAVLFTVIFAAIVIPIGLAIDFLSWPPSSTPAVSAVVAHAVGLFLTVAIPEELFFRGILLHGLDQMMKRRWLALLVSSLAFGLMHWNNASDLTTQIAYVALATLAGVFYGVTYRRSGNNLLAAVTMHTLVDLIWRFMLQ